MLSYFKMKLKKNKHLCIGKSMDEKNLVEINWLNDTRTQLPE